MTRRLNIPLLAALIIGSVLFVGIVYFVHGFQVRRNADGLLRRASVAREKGDLDETVRLMRRYLAHRPDDADQFMQIALDAKENIFTKAANRQTPTRKELDLSMYLMEEAVRKSGFLKRKDGSDDLERRQELRREAATFWFSFRRYDIARDNLESIEEAWTDEDRLLHIECLRFMGSPAEEDLAIEKLEEIVGYDRDNDTFSAERAGAMPKLLNAYQSLVALLVQKRLDRDQAEQVIDQLLVANPDNAEAHLMYSRLIRYIRNQEGKDKAYAAIQKSFELDKENVDILAAMSAMKLEQKKYDEAKQLIEEGLERATEIREKSRLYDLLAQVYITQSDIDGALTVLERGNKEVPADRELLWKKARLLLDRKQHKDVEAMYKPLQNAKADPALIGYLQARILMDKGEYRVAEKAMTQIRPLVQPILQLEIDTYLSVAHGVLGQHDKRLDSVKNLLAVQPNNQKAQEGYVQSLMMVGQNKEAYEYLKGIIRQYAAQDPPAELPTQFQLLALQLRIKIEIGEARAEVSDETIQQIQKQLQKVFNNLEIPQQQRMALLIDYFQRMNNPKKAKEYVLKALEGTPDSFPLWALRLNYAESKEEAAEIMQQIRSNVDMSKHEPSLRGFEAKLAIKFDRENADAIIKQQEANISEFSPEQQAALLQELGTLQLAMNNRNEGIRLLEAANKAQPRRLDILSTLYRDATQHADANRVNDLVGRIKSVTGPDDDTYRLAESSRLIWMIRNGLIAESKKKAALNQARLLMAAAQRNRPQHIPVMLLQADIERESGEVNASIETLKRAHELQPANPQLIRLIAQSYKNIGNISMMTEWMQRLPLSMRSTRDKRVELTTLWLRRNSWTAEDVKDAIDLVNEIAPVDSEVTRDLLQRSNVYLQAKQPDVALAAVRRAKELDPQSSEVWITLVNVLIAQDKRREAEDVIQEAELELPEQTKPLVLGRCYALLGDFNQAQSNFSSAIRSNPDNAMVKRMYAESLMSDNKAQQAAKMVEQILETADKEKDKEVLAWARRTMARFLSNSGSYAAFTKGLELLDANRNDGELMANEDLALWVYLCYARPEKQSWNLALDRLDAVSAKRPLNDDELFMKAQLYEKYDDEALWEQAKSMTMDVLSRNKGNTKIIESYVKWLLKRGELDAARKLAGNNLEQATVTRQRVELHEYAQTGKIQEALTRINSMTPANPQTTEELSTVLTLSVIAEELGQYNPGFYKIAWKLLSTLMQKRPRESSAARYINGTAWRYPRRSSRRLTLCENAGKQGAPDSMRAGVALAILRQHQEKWSGELAPVVKSTGAWIGSAAAANPSDTTLQWRTAEYMDMIGNLSQAAAEYQKLLDNPKFNNPIDRGMVLNNLAYVLALTEDQDKPLQLVKEAESLLGPTSDLIDTRGFAHYVRGEFQDAIDDFEAALSDGPGAAQKLFHLALAMDKAKVAGADAKWTEAMANGLKKSQLPIVLHDEFNDMSVKFGQ